MPWALRRSWPSRPGPGQAGHLPHEGSSGGSEGEGHSLTRTAERAGIGGTGPANPWSTGRGRRPAAPHRPPGSSADPGASKLIKGWTQAGSVTSAPGEEEAAGRRRPGSEGQARGPSFPVVPFRHPAPLPGLGRQGRGLAPHQSGLWDLPGRPPQLCRGRGNGTYLFPEQDCVP